jgi:hypothetical protein
MDMSYNCGVALKKRLPSMNERINGLWWKARIGYNNQNCDPEVLEKFAELIVEECAEIANDHNSEIEGVTLGVGRALKQHFGVEE